MNPMYRWVVNGKITATLKVKNRLTTKRAILFLLSFKTSHTTPKIPIDNRSVRSFNILLFPWSVNKNWVFQKLYSHQAGTGINVRNGVLAMIPRYWLSNLLNKIPIVSPLSEGGKIKYKAGRNTSIPNNMCGKSLLTFFFCSKFNSKK